MFVDEANGDVDNIPSDGEGLDGDDDTSDEESEVDSDVSIRLDSSGVLTTSVTVTMWYRCICRYCSRMISDAGKISSKILVCSTSLYANNVLALLRPYCLFPGESRIMYATCYSTKS